jgi:hypothetical protein
LAVMKPILPSWGHNVEKAPKKSSGHEIMVSGKRIGDTLAVNSLWPPLGAP